MPILQRLAIMVNAVGPVSKHQLGLGHRRGDAMMAMALDRCDGEGNSHGGWLLSAWQREGEHID